MDIKSLVKPCTAQPLHMLTSHFEAKVHGSFWNDCIVFRYGEIMDPVPMEADGNACVSPVDGTLQHTSQEQCQSYWAPWQ